MATYALVHAVDDDVAVRRSLAFLLTTDGLAVRVHDSASAFLESVADPAGCIVTDVRMPGVDGIDFLRRLRQRGPMSPVLVMTGHADVPLAVEAMREGAGTSSRSRSTTRCCSPASGRPWRRRRGRRTAPPSIRRCGRAWPTLSERERQVLDGLVAGKAK